MKNFNKLHLFTLEKARMLKKGIAFLMILTIGFSSCKKEIDNYGLLKNGKEHNTQIQKLTLSDIEKHVANPLNPMDKIGRLHNEGMKAVLTDELIQSKNDPVILKKAIIEFTKKQGFDTESYYKNFKNVLMYIKKSNRYIRGGNAFGFYKELLNDNKISYLQYVYFGKMRNTMDDLENIVVKNNGNLLRSYIDLNKRVKEIESELLKDKSFKNENEKTILFAATSIFRYSMFNYLTVISDVETPLYSTILPNGSVIFYIEGDTTPSVMVANWGKIGQADIDGVAGGFIGVGVYALFFPVAYPAVIAAGLTGAIGSSVWELVKQLWSGEAYFLADWR